MTRVGLLVFLAFGFALALPLARPAHAQWGNFGIDFTDTFERGVIYDHIRGTSTSRGSAAKSTVVPKRTARMPATIAASAPVTQRGALERQYATLFATYEQMVPKLHLTDHDLAGAMALLVCESYAAYHDTEVTDTALTATAKQLHDMLGGSAAFAKLTTGRKQDMYEQVAIASTMLVVGLEAAKTDPARRDQLHDLGKQYLAGFADPDQVQITDKGLTIAK